MAEGKQVRVNLTFDANVDRARQAMQKLQSDLEKLSSQSLQLKTADGVDRELLKASQAAAQLKINLESAFNTKTGNIDLVKFNTSMQKAGMSAQKYQEALSALGPTGNQAFAQLALAISKADAPLTRVNSKLNEFAISLKNTAKWQISSSILHGLTGSINQAFGYAQSLNASLNDIRIVTGASTEEMAKFAAQANLSAKALSTSTKSYAEAALIFYQQGLSGADVKDRSDVVMKMANVTKDSAAQVSSYMTAIWNNFDNGSASLEHYADVMTALGAATASSTAEIADGLEKFASIGKTIGLSYDYATSALATIVSQTRQSADTVGTGLRTIFSRLQGLSLGETLEDGVNLNKYSQALNAVGVQVLDATGHMRDMDSILESLADKWQNLSGAQKTALAQTVGGVRQYTTLISLMDNWDSMETNLSTAKNADGALQSQADIYAESWDAAKTRVKASAEAIYSSLINDKFFIGLNNVFSGFLDSINNLVTGLGGLKGVLMSLTPIVTAIFGKQIVAGVQSMTSSIKNFLPGGKRRAEQTRTDFINQSAAMVHNTSMPGGAAMADQYKRTANLYHMYSQNSQFMGAEQQKLAQFLLQKHEGTTARIQASGDAADASTNAAYKANISAQAAIKSQGTAQADAARQAAERKRTEETERIAREKQAELDRIEQERQARITAINTERNLKTRNSNKVKGQRINKANAEAEARREAVELKYRHQEREIQTQNGEAAAAKVGKKVERAQAAQATYARQMKAEGFQGAAADALKIKVDASNVEEAKKKMLELVEIIKKAAQDQDIDLGSPDEDGSFAKALAEIEAKAKDANASVAELQAAQVNLEDAVGGTGLSTEETVTNEAGETVTRAVTPGEEYRRSLADLDMSDEEVTAQRNAVKDTSAQEGADILRLAQDSAEAQKAAEELEAKLKDLSDVKVDFSSGFMASISAITAVGTAINGVMSLINTWQDDSVSVGQKIATTLMTVGMVAGSLGSAFLGANGALIANTGATIAAALGWVSLEKTIDETGKASLKMIPKVNSAGIAAQISGFIAQSGWIAFMAILVAVAAVIAIVVGVVLLIVNAATAASKAEAELTAENEKLRESVAATGEAMKQLEGDLQSLSAVMHDTSLSYEEQLAKINEITNAYGVQASALDVLTGNYAGLESQMKAALLAREGALIGNSEDYIQQINENSDALLDLKRKSKKNNDVQEFEALLSTNNEFTTFDQGFMQGSGTMAADAYAQYNWSGSADAYKAYMARLSGDGWFNNEMTDKQQDRIFDVLSKKGLITVDENGNITERLDRMFNRDGSFSQEIIDLEQWMKDAGYASDDYEEIVDYLNERKSAAAKGGSALNAALSSAQDMGLTDEGKAWQEFLAKEENQNLGLRWDSETNSVQLSGGALTGAQYAQLYERMMSEGSGLEAYVADGTGFTGQLADAAEAVGADIAATAESQIERAQLISSIINSDDFTFMTDTHTRDYQELLNFKRKDSEGKTTSLLDSDFETAMETAKYLSGFEEYSEAGMQMQAIGELATKAGQVHSKGDAANATKYRDEIYKELQSQLASGAIDIETALQISPSGITVTVDGDNVNVEIAPEAIALAEQKVAKDLQLKIRTNVDAIYDVATKDNLTYEDIQKLQKSEYFKDNPEDAVRFASQSAAQRKLELDSVKQQTYIDEAEANRQLVASLEAEQARLQTNQDSVINQAIADFGEGGETRENLFEAIDTLGLDSTTLEKLQGMNGQELYEWAKQALDDQRKTVSGLQQQQTDLLAKMGYSSIDEAKAALEDGNLDDDTKAELEKQIADYELSESAEGQASKILTEYENLLSGVTQAEQELLSVSTQLKIAQGDQAALDWWATYGAEITKATNAADSFSKAIGKKGQLNADDLTYLQAYDPEGKALDNYQNMSSQEWDKYAMESAVAYYDELYAYYDGDVAKQIEILQLKQQAQQQYYDSVAEMANQAAEVQQEKWDEAKNAASDAMSSSSDMMTGNFTFTGIDQLKQDMLDAGVATERVTELINDLMNAGDDKGQIKAAMIAASEAALAKLGTLHEEKQEYTGLVTSLDTSPIEPINLNVGATTGEVDDTTLDNSRTDFEETPITPTFDTPEGQETVEGELSTWGDTQTITYTNANGETVTGVINSWGDGKTVTFTTANGEQVTGTIESFGGGQTLVYTDADGNTVKSTIEGFGGGQKVVYTTADGKAVTGTIMSWGAGQTVTFTTADGTKVTGTISGYGNNQKLTYTKADGTTVTATINAFGDGKQLTYTTADGTTVTGTIESWGTGQKIVYATADGTLVTATIQGWGTNQTIIYATANGDAVGGTIASWGSAQTITYTTADGTAVTGTITGWGANKTVTFTTADGTAVTGTIQDFGGGQKLVYTAADGSTVEATIDGFGSGQTLSFSTAVKGQTLQASMDKIGVGQTIEFTNPTTGATFTDTIAGWTFTNDGLTLNLASGAQTTVSATVLGWTGFTNNSLVVSPTSTTEGNIQTLLSAMNFTIDAEVNLQTKAALQAVSQLTAALTTGLDPQAMAQVVSLLSMSTADIIKEVNKAESRGWFREKDTVWGAADQATMGYIVQNLLEMDESELTDLIKSGTLQQIIDGLKDASTSLDGPTATIAQALYDGLKAGLTANGTDWDSVLAAAGIGPDIIQAFKTALGIHSPSALTKALAPWLFEGLRVGIAEADANFDIAPLEGVRSVIATKFQDAMRNALSDGHLDLNEIPGLDENFVAHYNNIMAMEGETEAEKYEAYKTQIGDKAVEDYIAKKGQEAYDNAVHRNNVNGIRNRDRAMVMLDHDGQIVSQPIKPLPRIDPNKARTDAIAAATADQAELDKVRAAAIANFENEFYTQLESTVGKWQQDYIVNKKWNDDNSYSNTQKAILNGAVEAALKEGGWANIDDAMADGGEKFLSLVQANIDKSGKDLEIEISDTWNELQDIWVEGLNKMYEAEQELAQKTYELWQKTFTAIANARLGLLDGKSIMESMFDKPEEIASIIETYLNKGMSMSAIMDMLYNRNAQVNFDPWDAESYHNSGAWKYVNRDANGNYTDTTVDQYNANLRTDLTHLASAELADVVGKSLSQTKIDEWASSGDHAKLALLDFLSTKGVVQKNTAADGSISYAATGKELSKEFIDGIVDMMMQSYKATSQAQVNSYIAEGASVQRTQYYQRADKARQEGEAYINAQQADFDVVTKAREAMLKGEDLKYALTAEEQKQLLEITKKSDLTAVSLGDLDNASTTLTNTMILCAQQLAVAMGMIERGEATSFNIDKETGAVTVTKTSVNQDEVDKFLTSKQITRDDMGNYYQNGQAITEATNAALWKEIQNVIKNNTTTTSVPLSGAPSNNTGDVLDNAGAGNDDAVRLQYAQEAGYGSLQEQDDYIDYLIEESKQAGITDEADLNREYLEEMANDIMEVEKAWQDLYETQASNIAIMKQGRKGTLEYQKALTSLTKTVKKVFGGAESVTEEFVEQHLEDIEKMADGDEKALERVEDALLSKILGTDYNITVDVDLNDDGLDDKIGDVIDGFNDIELTIDGISQALGDVQEGTLITPQIDTTGATGALIGLLNQGGETAAGIMEALNAIGWTPEVDVETYPVESRGIINGVAHYEYMDSEGNIHTFTGGSEGFNEETMTITVPKIGENGATQYKGLRKTGAGTSTTGDKRGGGGGGGARRRYLAKAKPEDHKERYHEINNAIDEVTDALDRLNKQQDRAWGAERLKSMQAESEELKKQRDLIRKKTEEAQKYLEQDLADAAQYGWTFDEENNVSNYEDNWNKLLDVYNAKIAEYNAMSAEQQEALEKDVTEANENGKTEYINPDTGVAFGSYEEYLKYHYLDQPTAALEQVEETMDELEQLGIDYDDVLNALYDNFIDSVQTKWDTANEIADANIEYLEHKISRLEDNAYKAAETIGLMSDKMDYTQDKFNAATTALDDLLKGYDAAWSAEAIMAGQVTAEDLAGVGMDANAVELVQNIMSELMDLEQEMTDTLIESFESMTEAFDEFNEDLDRYISTIEHAQSITSTYRNIIDLTGKSMSGFSTELLKAFNSATIDQAKANMKSNKTKYDTVQAEYDEAYQQYLNAQTLHAQGKLNDAALKAAKEAFEATQDNLNEAQEAYVASWEAALQAVADAYTSTMEGVMDEISKNLTNGLAGGLDALQERMDRMKTKDSNYVDDYEKIYQLTKLTRDLETQIDKTSNVRAQKELLKFQKEINGILQSDKKLSEYDIDYLQKKYDLKLAEIALEDAQNAKSQVTMRRDSEGNYNYVYTADENAVAEAEAEYATKLYEMQKANDEYITSLSDSIVSLKVEMRDALLALDPSQFASEEEFNAAVEELIAFYTEQMSYHQEQLETVLGNNKDLYEKDMVWYNKYANYKMADAASFIDSWNETLLAQATGFETMDELFETFFSQAEVAQSESVTAYRNYVDAINAINAEAGHPTETLAQSLTEDIEAMTDQAEQAATDMQEHAETIVGEITSIGQAIEEMANKFGVEIVNMAKQTDLLVAALTDMLEIMGKAGDIELEEGLLADIEARRQAREQEYASQSFDTGGYTGAWGPEGKLAWLHQKELVLNAADTENILASVGILRQIANTIDLNALTSAGGFISLMSSGISGNKETLQQEVHIEASFPAVTDKNQIEDAFTDLVNLAAQYANRK